MGAVLPERYPATEPNEPAEPRLRPTIDATFAAPIVTAFLNTDAVGTPFTQFVSIGRLIAIFSSRRRFEPVEVERVGDHALDGKPLTNE